MSTSSSPVRGFGEGGRTRAMAAERPKPRSGSILAMYRRMFLHVRSRWLLLVVAAVSMLTVAGLEFVIPRLTQYTIDTLIPGRLFDKLPWVAGGVLLTALLLGLFQFLSSLSLASVGQQALFDLRSELYRHIQKLDIGFFDRNRTGDLMSRVTSDVGMLQQLISSGMMSIVTDIITFAAVATYMFYVDWQLTLIVMATFPLMMLTTRLFGTRMRSTYRNVQESVAEVSNHLQDTLSSIRLIRSFAAESYETERFAGRSQRNMAANLRAVRLRSVFEPVVDLLNYAGYAAVLVFGARQAMNGSMTVGEVVAFIAYVRLLQSPIRHLSRTINTILQSAAAYDRIVDILATEPAVRERPGATPLPPVDGRIEFRRVSFAYQEGRPVLRDFDFVLEPGQVTALVGSSGAGKSTIAHLLTRFYDPQDGDICIDGHKLTDITLNSLRSQMGVVSQDIVLLNGTIRENIIYGKRDATEEEIIAAARAAGAHEFISSYPDGYDSQVGERGVKLSGGQKQRLSIARALLKNPRIVILDEATSALDTESEHTIQEALGRLLAGRTCLVIAHRLSTIRRANRICVMESGRIVESGSHEQLLAEGSRYKRLHDLQFPQQTQETPDADTR